MSNELSSPSPQEASGGETREMKSGYAFIVSQLDVRLPMPVAITPTLRIEAASDSQIEQIRQTVSLGGLPIDFYYQYEWVARQPSEGGTGHRSEPLPRGLWRYFVLTWSNWHAELFRFQQAVNLVPPGILSYAPMVTEHEFGRGAVVGRFMESASIPDAHKQIPPKRQVFDSELLESWRQTLSALEQFDSIKHAGIARAVELFNRFYRLPLTDDLRILGLFMVLEMLLTHNPNAKEIGDSLSHQICTKVALLESRLARPLDYSAFGQDANADSVWKKLYAFRSAIAHGGTADFGKTLKLLRTADVATAFLADATARILRHALNEPVLFDSLKPV